MVEYFRQISASALLRARLSHAYDTSVVRRTLFFGMFLGPAFVANSAMFYFGARLLPAADFGILYLAYVIQNVAFSGSIIINIFLTRHYKILSLEEGAGSIKSAARAVERSALRLGSAAAVTMMGLMAIGGKDIGAHSWYLSVLVPLDVLGSYFCDLERAAIQSSQRTTLLGTFTLSQMVLRSGIGIAGVAVVGTVWAGLVGWITSSMILYMIFRPIVCAERVRGEKGQFRLPSLKGILPLVLGYGTVMGFCYLDVILAYLKFSPVAFGVYSASSVLPKMVLTGVMPIMLMLFPLMVNETVPANIVRRIGLVLTGLAGSAGMALMATSPISCQGAWGIHYCQVTTFASILLSLVPLTLLRLLVFVTFATGRNWMPLWILLPIAAFIAIVANFGLADPAALAKAFAAFATISLVFFWFILRQSTKLVM